MPESIAIDSRGPSGPRLLARSNAVKLALWYAIFGTVWIFCSGWALRYLIRDQALRDVLEYAKGWAFVGITAFLLGWVLYRQFHKTQLSLEQIQDSEAKLRLVGDNLPDSYVYQFTHDEAAVRDSLISPPV